MKENKEELKTRIISELKDRKHISLSGIQTEFKVGFALAEEIYFELEETIAAKSLKKLINKKVKSLPKNRAEFLLEETNHIISHGGALRMMTAFKIASYLHRNNEHFILSGALHSSYVAYELGINIVDTFKYSIHPEICHGIDYTNSYSIDFRVSAKSIDKVLKYIDKLLSSNRLLRVSGISNKGKTFILPGRRVLLLDKSLKKQAMMVKDCKNEEHECLDNEDVVSKNRDKLIVINILGSAPIAVINDMFKKLHKKIPPIENMIKENPHIIEKLCRHYDDLNIEKCYLPEFRTDYTNEIIKTVQPKTINDLIKLISVGHGSDAWDNNQEALIKNKIITIDELIGSRDDVADYLISKGYPKDLSIKIMESVRKGQFNRENINELGDLSETFIKIISKVKYLFPRGHCIALLYNAIYHEYLRERFPEEFFKTYIEDMLVMSPPWFYADKEDKLLRYIKELKSAPINNLYETKYYEAIKGAKLAILLIKLNLTYLWYEI